MSHHEVEFIAGEQIEATRTQAAFGLTVGKPTGTTEGDLMIASVLIYEDDATPGKAATVPTGWTELRDDVHPDQGSGSELRLTHYSKVAGASEPLSYQWAWGDTGEDYGSAGIYTLRNYSEIGNHDSEIALSATVTSPGVDVELDGSARLTIMAVAQGATIGSSSNFTHDEQAFFTGELYGGFNSVDATGDEGDHTQGVFSSVRNIGVTIIIEGATDRTAQVTWAEMEVPAEPRKAQVTHAELEVPTFDRAAVVTWATLEIDAEAIPESDIDFTRYHAYLDGQALIYDRPGQTNTVPLRPVRQDVGNNPNELRPESGDIFGQSDFSHGANQTFFHRENRDPAKYFYGEGFDIEDPGVLRHLHDVDQIADITAGGDMVQAGGALYVAHGLDVKRTIDLINITSEDPEAGGTPTAVASLTTNGTEVFAALGAEGVHYRPTSGTWAHYQPDASTDLDVGTATIVRWIRGRLFVVGTAGVAFYEIVADSTPTAIGDNLTAGWEYADIFPVGNFIYGAAVNEDDSESFYRIFGLKDDLSGYEWKGDSYTLPQGQLGRCGLGYLGKVWLGGGKANHDGGYDPVLYQAVQDEAGFLLLEAKIAEGEGAEAVDLGVRSIVPDGETIIFGWSLGDESTFGSREGMGIYYPARGAFAHHHAFEVEQTAPKPPLKVGRYLGRHIYTTSEGLFAEDMDDYAAEAFIVSSIGDWNNAGLKVWSRVTIHCKPPPTGTRLDVYYSASHPEENSWTFLGQILAGQGGNSFVLSDVESRLFAIKIESTAHSDQSVAPEVVGFDVRSDPSLDDDAKEWDLVRFVRIHSKDRKDRRGEVIHNDPVEVRNSIHNKYLDWVTLREPNDVTWTVRLVEIADVMPAHPLYSDRQGESGKDAWIMQLKFRGTRSA